MTSLEAFAGGGAELFLGCPDQAALATEVRDLVAASVASGIATQDPTLWGGAAEDEAAKRLAWVALAQESRSLVAEIAALRSELNGRGLDHVVLCGMGGSSLAPEVICATDGVALTVLDSSDPDTVRAAIADRLERSIVVVSSKSGGTVETDSQRRAYEEAFGAAGLDPAAHIVVVTDPGSPLDGTASAAGYRVFRADPGVGGRYSALTAFGLVPSGLAGADIGRLLDEAAALQPLLEADSEDNPGLRLGALLGLANSAGADKVVLAENGSGIVGFGDWVEQLIAESTGKDGHGILPVVVADVDSPNFTPNTADEVLCALGHQRVPLERLAASYLPASGYAVCVHAPLGAAMLLWEYAVAVAGRLIGINPFDQPDVESAKQAARDQLETDGPRPEPAYVVDGTNIGVHASKGLLPSDAATLADAIDALLDQLDPKVGYVSVQAYLDRHEYARLADVRDALARRTGRPVTFGWGPRFLHSTGQYHKGGPPTGVFLQLTSDPTLDLDIPGRSFTFGEFIRSQAAGDAAVLADHGRPVLTLDATHADDIARIGEALS